MKERMIEKGHRMKNDDHVKDTDDNHVKDTDDNHVKDTE